MLNKEENKIHHDQQIKLISIEKGDKNLSESRTFLRLFPKNCLTYDLRHNVD